MRRKCTEHVTDVSEQKWLFSCPWQPDVDHCPPLWTAWLALFETSFPVPKTLHPSHSDCTIICSSKWEFNKLSASLKPYHHYHIINQCQNLCPIEQVVIWKKHFQHWKQAMFPSTYQSNDLNIAVNMNANKAGESVFPSNSFKSNKNLYCFQDQIGVSNIFLALRCSFLYHIAKPNAHKPSVKSH